MARVLLDCSADPNVVATGRTTLSGMTALLMACGNGHLPVVQLLIVYGADSAALALVAECDEHFTAQRIATIRGHATLAHWLVATADHVPAQIAIGCRLHAEAQSALRSGVLGDPTTCTVAQLMQAATNMALWGTGLGMPPVCSATMKLAHAVVACWSPERHWLYHAGVRSAVCAVLLVRQRLEDRGGGPGAALPHLPLELWFAVCAMLLRRDWVYTRQRFQLDQRH